MRIRKNLGSKKLRGMKTRGVCGVEKGRKAHSLLSSTPASSRCEFVRIWVSLQGRVPFSQREHNPSCPAGRSQTRGVTLAFPFSSEFLQASPVAGEIPLEGLNLEA